MRAKRYMRRVRVLIALGVVLSISLILGVGEEIGGVGAGEAVGVEGIKLAKYGNPVAVMGQLTIDGEAVPGSFFFLFYDPLGTNGSEKCGAQLEHYFPEGTEANGAQVSFIQYPNAIVTFSIAPSQFSHGYIYELPFLPEDPPGAGALEFF